MAEVISILLCTLEKKIILAPLSPNDVREDQKKMKEKYAQAKEKYAQEKEKETEKEKKESFMAKKEEIKNAIVTKQPLYLLFCKEVVFTSSISS